VVAAGGQPAVQGPAAELNLKYNNDVQSAMARILAHPKFDGITNKYGVDGAALDVEKYKEDLQNKGFHRFEGNVFMLSLESYDDAPSSRARTDKWMNKHYAQATGSLPEDMNYTFKLAGWQGGVDPSDATARGKFSLISPSEPLDALIFRIDQAISEGEDEDTLDKWVQAVLTAPLCVLCCVSVEDVSWKRISEREAFGHGYELLYRTAIGRAFEVIDVMNRESARLKREATATEVETAWLNRVEQSGMSDKVTAGYVDTVLKCKKRIFNDSEATAKLLMAEDQWMRSTPWDSLYKLECLATKLGARDSNKHSVKLNWMIDYIHDRFRAGFSEKGEFSVRSLSGKGMPNNKGLLDTALFKLDLCQHSLDVVLESIPGSKESKAMIRQYGGDFEKYRASFGYPNDIQVKANPWVSLLEKPVQMYQNFHTTLIFSQDFDSALKLGMRAGRSVEEMFDEGTISQRVTEILDVANKAEGAGDLTSKNGTEDTGGRLHGLQL
jgi:hypothetical protein